MGSDGKGGLLLGLIAVLAIAMLYFQQPENDSAPANVPTKPIRNLPVSRDAPSRLAPGTTVSRQEEPGFEVAPVSNPSDSSVLPELD